MTKYKVISIAVLVASIIFAIASWILLPETVITQVGTSRPTTMPKIAAIGLPTLMCGVCSVLNLVFNYDAAMKRKLTFVEIVGLFVFIVMLVVNL